MKTLDLTGSWSVRREGEDKAIPASVPGCIHLDLLEAGRIPDPFYRDNEKDLEWISLADWIYSREFTLPEELWDEESVVLRCEGLDTLASITINGQQAAKADNMFRTWEFDVKKLLKPGSNTIEVRFESALRYTRAKQAKRYIHAWLSRDGVQYLRKESCNYGWDWGPRLITCGIWRPIFLEAWSASRIADVLITQEHAENEVTIALDVELRKPAGRRAPAQVSLTATLYDGEETVASDTVTLGAADSVRFEFEVQDPKLWWPRGLGDQPLYDLLLELRGADQELLDTWDKSIGLRTLRLDRHADAWGESFQFVVNGVPFFAKGANWIPADAFVTRVTPQQYLHLLGSAAEANMNMLRVWGGGIYEQDVFYELCDELGICVWQDFMFACSCYPTFDRAYMANVRKEAEDNIRRLRHHASLAFWCGNNELEQGICGPAWTEHQMPWEEYAKLCDKLLPEVVAELDPQRDYWPGSPHNPGENRQDCNNPDSGDAHLWAVWHRREPFEWYRTAMHRFCSEFGFQSFPEPRTIDSFTIPEDHNISSYIMDYHQRSWVGNGIIMSYMLSWYLMPKDFESLVWLSQIEQGMAMKYAVEHWRRQMPRSMGTLYWQLNDTWPAPSWSSIDYFGRWKACNYHARRFFAPLMVSLLEKPEEKAVEAWISNDLREDQEATLRLIVTDCAGKELRREEKQLTAEKLKSQMAFKLDVGSELEARTARDVVVWAELEAPGQPVSRNLATFARPKHLLLRDPAIKTRIKRMSDGIYNVTLTARYVAMQVWLEVEGIDTWPSDNFFDLRPGQPVTVTVYPQKELGKEEFAAALKVRSLYNTSR